MERTNWLEFKPAQFEYNGKWIKNWFSNMVPFPIFVGGEWEWPSVENYYQAMKTEDKYVQECIRISTPRQAKHMGKNIYSIRPNWPQMKEGFMKRALEVKFACSIWFNPLMATGDDMIIEWNNWGDQYWGATLDGVGKNRLGVLLMEIREEYKKYQEK